MKKTLLAALLLAVAPLARAGSSDAGPSPEPTPTPAPAAAAAQDPAAKAEEKPRLDIYGFAMLDTGYQTKQNDPNWYDVLRPTKLPAYTDEYGKDGHWFAGVRQSRFGVKSFAPTGLGELKTIFEFELFGTGVDAGQTTFRLRHAWGELGQIGAGQTWSPFMDSDVFPNSVEYWGPNGMVFFRNVQLRWTPWQKGDSNFMVALERPGASADGGIYADRVELQNVKARFPLPDFSAHFRYAQGWGHVQLAGILRSMKWDDLNPGTFDLTGSATGWGLNLSSNIKLQKHVARLQVVYGDGIENYMNDAPVDVGVQNNLSNPRTPVVGKTLPVLGVVAFLDLNWDAKWTSTVGYSLVKITNSDAQNPSDFRRGQYALANVLYHPTPDVFLGPEVQWGKRENYTDGFTSDDFRIQFSAKYNFKLSLGGK
ncbi:MAG TPA: DcaP family trimeric outer membrane transporter [Vicinamibacteria bacterium]|nr:DcaP family trimeric outer membrane transporter [Vicinamibacteria bacterium]